MVRGTKLMYVPRKTRQRAKQHDQTGISWDYSVQCTKSHRNKNESRQMKRARKDRGPTRGDTAKHEEQKHPRPVLLYMR